MTDVYNRSILERNSIQSVPDGYASDSATNLFRFMGSFWKNIHEGRDFVHGIQDVRGIRMAQFYLDLLESLKLQDRNGIPVFHRELWKPLVIRKSAANSSKENLLSVGTGIVLGEQPQGSKYGEGTVLNIGSLGSFPGYVTYPVDGDISEIVSGIANNVINPTVFYKIGTEFPGSDIVYSNGTLIFPKDKDPFSEGSGFDVYDVVADSGDISDVIDQETVLWAADALIDRKYLAEHMSYALGIGCPSSEIAKRIINAGWSSLNCGLTPNLLRELLAAMVNIPVIQESEETVTGVYAAAGEDTTVTTDRHTYTVFRAADLRSVVKIGAVLHKGDFLDTSMKVYPLLTDPSPDRLLALSEYAESVEQDIPVISIPKAIVRTNIRNDLAVDWTPSDVIDTLETYGEKKHKKLYFEFGGDPEDVMAFWEDVWVHAEKEDVDLEELFLTCSYDDGSSGSDDVWKVVPARFFLKYMIGGNTLIVTLATDQISDLSNLRNPMFFNLLSDAMPSGMRLFFVEHLSRDDDDDAYRVSEGPSADAEDTAGMYALENADYDDDEFDYSDLPGMRGKRIPTYEDQVEMKLFRNRKRNAD